MNPDAVQQPGEATWRAIARSWLSMKPWIKVWLFFLNGVFLAAFAFDDPLRDWALLAYLGSGLFLFPIMARQRGLTRFLGTAHLIPWVPLLIYLELRVSTTIAGPQITWSSSPTLFGWSAVLWGSLVICLALDAWDLLRWKRGERFVLGSAAAVRAGASGPAPEWS